MVDWSFWLLKHVFCLYKTKGLERTCIGVPVRASCSMAQDRNIHVSLCFMRPNVEMGNKT